VGGPPEGYGWELGRTQSYLFYRPYGYFEPQSVDRTTRKLSQKANKNKALGRLRAEPNAPFF
jgi:hypothetical protein